MDGSATFTIETSRITMNWPRQTTSSSAFEFCFLVIGGASLSSADKDDERRGPESTLSGRSVGARGLAAVLPRLRRAGVQAVGLLLRQLVAPDRVGPQPADEAWLGD